MTPGTWAWALDVARRRAAGNPHHRYHVGRDRHGLWACARTCCPPRRARRHLPATI